MDVTWTFVSKIGRPLDISLPKWGVGCGTFKGSGSFVFVMVMLFGL